MENVSFSFANGPKIFDNFSLSVKKGEFVYIKGLNGSGKSTLLKILCGLIPPTTGNVSVFGKEPHRNPEILKRLGIVIDGMGLYRELSLRENILLFARQKGVTPEMAEEALKKYVRMWNIDFNRKYKKSSHGMRKIAKLTLSLINDPELLIWDEPELALDKKRHETLVNLLRDYKENGKTCIIAGTNPDMYQGLIDRVIEKEVTI
jgi:ABC-2 type transport system ATP-binding protein